MKNWFVFGLIFLLIPGIANACMILPWPGQEVKQVQQKAVIWWDGKTETLIESVTYSGNPREFAWIIPVPNKPEVEEATDELFSALESLTNPTAVAMPEYGRGDLMIQNPSLDSGVRVIETKKIDIYDVTVLTAQDGNELRKWLTTNGYKYPEDKEYLLENYVGKDWYFVVAKVRPGAVGYAGAGLSSGHATPLKITFAATAPIYPLRISGMASEEKKPTNIVASWSFEDGTRVGWSAYSTPLVNAPGRSEVSTDTAIYGNRALKLSGVVGTWDDYFYTSVSGLVPGKTYTFSAYAIAGQVLDRGDAFIKVQQGGLSVTSKYVPFEQLNGWQRLEVTFVAKSSSHEFDLIAHKMDPKAVILWDGVQIEEGEKVTTYVDTSGLKIAKNDNLNVRLYVFAKHRMTAPGFSTTYAGWENAKTIKNLALDSEGKSWVPNAKNMYLTRLDMSIKQSEISGDVVLRDAENNDVVGGGKNKWSWDFKSSNGVAVILGLLIIELVGIGYIYMRRK